ncbi:hypothetical protein E5288_WYG002965 [Bos mutus]|uniref:Uncharacterized protein n=1 Tax=Bos mutus TaxID=72004 RepID=A0A6B0S5C0_9CETA|nr:hypothetical protein [Bos mutus]
MGGIFGKVKEREPEIDIYDISFEEEASTSKERKTNNSDQSNGLDREKIQRLMKKVESTLEQNPNRNKNRKSTILVFYYHLQNRKKKENGPMEDEETLEDSSNTSPDNSPSKPLCPPGAQDAEPSAVTPGKAKAE